MALTVPNTFAGQSGNVAASQLDTNYTTITGWINNRNPTSGLLSARPAAANAGALYFATDTGLLYLDSGTAWSVVGLGVIGTGILPGYLGGMGLSNDGASPNTVLDIAAGAASDSAATYLIQTTSAFTKATGGVWAAGSGANGMGTGLTITAATWYHVFAIINGGATDYYFDTSVTAANKPAGTTAFRRIGSFRTAGGSTNILAFTQDGSVFEWAAPVADVNGAACETAGVLRTLTVPLGVNVMARGYTNIIGAAGVKASWLYDPAITNTAVLRDPGPATLGMVDGSIIGAPFLVRTNTSSQVRSRQDAAFGTFSIMTEGWIDRRGTG